MSSPYPVLNNRPIDQWKVTELKEELKRRKLMTKGLKDDLIRRLDEALRVEAENFEENVYNGFEGVSQTLAGVKVAGVVPVIAETSKDVVDSANKIEMVDEVTVHVDLNESAPDLGQAEVQQGNISDGNDFATVETTVLVHETTIENSIMVTESEVCEVRLSGQDLQNTEIQKDFGDSKPQLESENSKFQLESEDSKFQLDSEDSKPQLENEDSNPQLVDEDLQPQLEIEDPKPLLENEDPNSQLENEVLKAPHEDHKLDSTTTDNQVSEVSPVLGSQVKSESISTASVSINEKIELKDNIIADNFKLELDVINPEMVEPLSSNVDQVGDKSHPMDVEEQNENKISLGENDDNSARHKDMNKKNDSADLGNSEKLNLDRSSGDDSMEEDVLESKQIASKFNYNKVREDSEKNGLPVAEEESPVDIVGDDVSLDKKDVHFESMNQLSVPAEKRKLHEQEALGSNEPLKRQRRWHSESIKVPDQQGSNLTPTTTPKDGFRSTSLKRSFSRTDSTTSEDTPKERVVPPSQTPPTNSLKIDRFLRPFTLRAVQELLGKTGSVTSFWMDQIKTHCYVTYSSTEEAIQTRNAVYNLQWPPNGGRLLLAEFVDPREVKMRVEAPNQAPSTPVGISTTVPLAPLSHPQPSPRQQVPRQQLPPPPSLPPPPPLTNPPPARERLPPPPPLANPPAARERLPPPPPLPEKIEPPIVTLDDLFRKTKATPRIYYLTLSEEQVAAKAMSHGKTIKR